MWNYIIVMATFMRLSVKMITKFLNLMNEDAKA